MSHITKIGGWDYFFCLHNELPNVNRSFPNRQHHIPVYKVNEASCELPRIPAKKIWGKENVGAGNISRAYTSLNTVRKKGYTNIVQSTISCFVVTKGTFCCFTLFLLLLFARYPGNVSVCFENPPPSSPKPEEEEEQHAIFCVRRRFTEPPSSLVEIQRFG